MNTDDLRRLSARAERVEGRSADRLAEVHARIRAARRKRAGAGAAAALAVVAAMVVGGSAITSTDRSEEPVDEPTPLPDPTPTPEVPAGQRTVVADIGPGDIGGWELVASRTNTRPGDEGATDLTLVGDQMPWDGTTFCHGDPDTWWVFLTDLGGVDGEQNADGSMQDGSRGAFGRCSQDDPTSPQPPADEIDPGERPDAPESHALRMFVTGPLSEPAQRCLRTTHAVSCPATHGIEPLARTDAEFGFGDYEEKPTPYVLEVPGLAPRRALAVAGDGVEYLVDRAVIAADGSERLVVRLPASDGRRIVELGQIETPDLRRCVDGLRDSPDFAGATGRCATELRLRIDGARPTPDDRFAVNQSSVPAGEEHVVTVEVVAGDPRFVRLALVIWEERL